MATVSLLMGSDSDLPTVKEACKVLRDFGVSIDVRVLSAHRCPEDLVAYVKHAEAHDTRIFIAAAGGAAHLAGVVAAHTIRPVLGIPIQTSALNGMDSLLSIVQMPGGIPVCTLAIGKAGATNAGLLAVRILATTRPELRKKLKEFQHEQARSVREETLS